MCGIFGIFSERQDLLNNSNNSVSVNLMGHRGPDDSGSYSDHHVFLGHTRLSIIDIASGGQPMISEDGRYVIVYNGEIYNYINLRDDLIKSGVDFVTASDTEVILKLYMELGPERALAKIEGMFAFCIWDNVDKVLFLARDRLGEKPLYYAHTSSSFVFASEIKAILNTGIIDDDLNTSGLYEYFCRGKVSGARTLLKNVYELNPGHYMLLDDIITPPHQRVYWDLVYEYRERHDKQIVDEFEAHTLIEECLLMSTNTRMLSDVPVGIFTSGGIDSSILAGMLIRSGHLDMECFSASNRKSDIDESPYAQLLVSYLNQKEGSDLRLSVIEDNINSFLDTIPYLSYIADEPLTFNSSMKSYALCRAAREHDIKVILTGEGADELFFGYDRHERAIRSIGEFKGSENCLEDMIYYGGGLRNAGLVSAICGTETRARDSQLLGESYQWLQENRDIPLRELVLLYDQRHRLQLINNRQDRMGMAASVELRQPFLNYRLVQLANSLHTGLKFDDGSMETKYILKRVSEKYVPREIVSRKKMGTPSDFDSWFGTVESHKTLQSLVHDKDSISRNYLAMEVIEDVLQKHYSASPRYDHLVKTLFFLEIWHRSMSGYDIRTD